MSQKRSESDSLEIAQRYAALIDRPPSTFLTLTRGLLLDHARGHSTPVPYTAFQLRRLAKGPSVLAPLYYSLFSLRSVSESDALNMSFLDLVSQYPNDELAALISVIYFVARAKNMSERDEWPFMSAHLEKSLSIGWKVGGSMKKIGTATGLLAGAFPIIGLSTFLKHDKAGFKEYRRSLKSNGKWLDHKYEMKKWGCTSFQVGAIFVQQCGFGIPIAGAFSAIDGRENFDNMEMNESFLKVWTSSWWIRGLYEKDQVPKPHPIQEEYNYFPPDDALDELVEAACACKDHPGTNCWFEKPKDSISPRSHPRLFGISSQPSASVAEPVDTGNIPSYDELPVHVKELLGQDEWESLGPEEAAQLIKEMGGEPTE